MNALLTIKSSKWIDRKQRLPQSLFIHLFCYFALLGFPFIVTKSSTYLSLQSSTSASIAVTTFSTTSCSGRTGRPCVMAELKSSLLSTRSVGDDCSRRGRRSHHPSFTRWCTSFTKLYCLLFSQSSECWGFFSQASSVSFISDTKSCNRVTTLTCNRQLKTGIHYKENLSSLLHRTTALEGLLIRFSLYNNNF